MQYKKIKDILNGQLTGNIITCAGWVRTRRDSKAGFSFIELNDGSCLKNLQIITDSQTEYNKNSIKDITTGSAVWVTGMCEKSPGQGQACEIKAQKIFLLGSAGSDYPLQKKNHTLEFLREITHLRTRTNTFSSIARIRNLLAFEIHQYFQNKGFLYLQTPIITASDCEGAGAMFRVSSLPFGSDYSVQNDFFGQEAFLTVSGQLEAETWACALGQVYTFGPAFRAENSNTPRHLAEFWMLEPEMAFYELEDNMNLAEDLVKTLCRAVLAGAPDEIAFFTERYDKTLFESLNKISMPFCRISYTEAINILEKADENFEFKPGWGTELHTEHEKYLTAHTAGPVIVFDFPASVKPFYMRCSEDGKTVRAMDVLLPRIGEIIGGSQREERLEILLARMQECGINTEHYRWYTDLRRYGTVPHSGFGLGFERLVQFITGMQNIRDVIPFPRHPGRAGF
ncbi:MAG: asparagine--tRNA ligase [Spirochaetes bacterium GWF1_41_5]|nr:MAG: asparagine--tRNA ligase [Spirochaetes bacterium GWF1_41_5]HBE01682.1 asparagine--tRNA ligase [Spirochaetia bacterium]